MPLDIGSGILIGLLTTKLFRWEIDPGASAVGGKMKRQQAHLGSSGIIAQRAIAFCFGIGLETFDDFDLVCAGGGEFERRISFKFKLHLLLYGLTTTRVKGDLDMTIDSIYCPVFWEDQCDIFCNIELLDGTHKKIGEGQFLIRSRNNRFEMLAKNLEGRPAWQELEQAIAWPERFKNSWHAIVG